MQTDYDMPLSNDGRDCKNGCIVFRVSTPEPHACIHFVFIMHPFSAKAFETEFVSEGFAKKARCDKNKEISACV